MDYLMKLELRPTCVQACNRGPEARQAGRYGKASLQIDTTPTQLGIRPWNGAIITAETLQAAAKLLTSGHNTLRIIYGALTVF